MGVRERARGRGGGLCNAPVPGWATAWLGGRAAAGPYRTVTGRTGGIMIRGVREYFKLKYKGVEGGASRLGYLSGSLGTVKGVPALLGGRLLPPRSDSLSELRMREKATQGERDRRGRRGSEVRE